MFVHTFSSLHLLDQSMYIPCVLCISDRCSSSESGNQGEYISDNYLIWLIWFLAFIWFWVHVLTSRQQWDRSAINTWLFWSTSVTFTSKLIAHPDMWPPGGYNSSDTLIFSPFSLHSVFVVSLHCNLSSWHLDAKGSNKQHPFWFDFVLVRHCIAPAFLSSAFTKHTYTEKGTKKHLFAHNLRFYTDKMEEGLSKMYFPTLYMPKIGRKASQKSEERVCSALHLIVELLSTTFDTAWRWHVRDDDNDDQGNGDDDNDD